MKSKDRQLLLIDLCGRLPYEVKGLHRGRNTKAIDNGFFWLISSKWV